MKFKKLASITSVIIALALGYYYEQSNTQPTTPTTNTSSVQSANSQQASQNQTTVTSSYATLAAQDFKSGDAAYLPVNHNQSTLNINDWQTEKIVYGSLDQLNRTTTATGYLSNKNLGRSEGRASQQWRPTGWHNQPVTINGRRITPQNRGHLLAYTITFNFDQNGRYQPGLDGSIDNPLNLATQSEYSNQKTMQIFEEKVRTALATKQKAIYQVTTVFRGNELMPRGYWVQAISSDGSLNFNSYVWNVEPGLRFDYATGRSTIDPTMTVSGATSQNRSATTKRYLKQSHSLLKDVTKVLQSKNQS